MHTPIANGLTGPAFIASGAELAATGFSNGDLKLTILGILLTVLGVIVLAFLVTRAHFDGRKAGVR
jgi:hypothetical protein